MTKAGRGLSVPQPRVSLRASPAREVDERSPGRRFQNPGSAAAPLKPTARVRVGSREVGWILQGEG